jgi:hypothetical protein
MKPGQHQRRILPLFGDGRKDADAPIAEFKNGFADIAFLVAHFDAVQSLDFDLAHLVGNGVVAVTCKSVDACSQEEVSTGILSDREQLINVALTVTNMDETLRGGKQRRRLLHVFKPAITLFLLDGNAGWVDPTLQGIGSMKFVAGPELDGGQPERKPLLRDDQAGVHENTRGRVVTRTVIASLQLMDDSDRVRFFAAVDELRCVMQDQHWTCVSAGSSLSRAEEMPRKNLLFIDTIVRQEPIRCLRRRPVLTGKRNASTDLLGKLPEQSAESLAVPKILKLAARNLAF